jgi:hypothetical protein
MSERDTPCPRRGPRIPRTKPYMKDTYLGKIFGGCLVLHNLTRMESSNDTSMEGQTDNEWPSSTYTLLLRTLMSATAYQLEFLFCHTIHLHINRNLQLGENHKAMAVFLDYFLPAMEVLLVEESHRNGPS